MDTYTIEFSEWAMGPSADRTVEAATLYVRVGDVAFPVRVAMSATLASILGYVKPDEVARVAMQQQMLKLALPRLRVLLDEMEAPTASTSTYLHKVDFSSENAASFKTKGDKVCQFQDRQPRGLICLAAPADDETEGKTSKALCGECSLPDDALRCSMLQHPAVIGWVSQDSRGRTCRDAYCDIKTDHFKSNRCTPGDHPCWRIAVDNQPPIIEVPADIEIRFVDELKYFDLSFASAFGSRLVKVNDPRGVATLAGECGSQQDFTFKVAAIADILTTLDLKGIASDIDPDTKGTLNRLAEYLQKKGVITDEQPIKTLRRVAELRNCFPIHSGNTAFLKACSELGIQYPPPSWDDAWRKVLGKAWSSFRALRLMLPS